MDLYQELELPQDCSFEEIKQQYRILARVHHPDMGGDPEKFKKIKLAYEVLSDPVRRTEYDKTGNTQKSIDIRHRAMSDISQMFFRMMPHFNPRGQGNILFDIKKEIQDSKQAIKTDMEICRTFITNLELAKTKIRKKTDNIEGDNIFLGFIDKQLESRNVELSNFKNRIEVLDDMIKILEEYHYGFLEIKNAPTDGGGFKHDGGG